MLLRRLNALPLPLDQLRTEMDRLLGSVTGQVTPMSAVPWTSQKPFPPLNLWEDADAIHAEAELPGVDPDSIDISVFGNELTLGGQRKATVDEDVSFHRQERPVGSFRRTVRLPVDVDADAVTATMNDGVLTIRLPKSESVKPRKINVSSV